MADYLNLLSGRFFELGMNGFLTGLEIPIELQTETMQMLEEHWRPLAVALNEKNLELAQQIYEFGLEKNVWVTAELQRPAPEVIFEPVASIDPEAEPELEYEFESESESDDENLKPKEQPDESSDEEDWDKFPTEEPKQDSEPFVSVIPENIFGSQNPDRLSNLQVACLMSAVSSDWCHLIEFLIEKGSLDIEHIYSFQGLSSSVGLENAELESTEQKVEAESNSENSNVSAFIPERWTLMTAAVQFERYSVISMLLEKNANLETNVFLGYAPIFLAVRNRSLGMAEFLISKGASVQIVHRNFVTPLTTALQNNHAEMAQLLLRSGGFPNWPLQQTFIDSFRSHIHVSPAAGIVISVLSTHQHYRLYDLIARSSFSAALQNGDSLTLLRIKQVGYDPYQTASCRAMKEDSLINSLFQLALETAPPEIPAVNSTPAEGSAQEVPEGVLQVESEPVELTERKRGIRRQIFLLRKLGFLRPDEAFLSALFESDFDAANKIRGGVSEETHEMAVRTFQNFPDQRVLPFLVGSEPMIAADLPPPLQIRELPDECASVCKIHIGQFFH